MTGDRISDRISDGTGDGTGGVVSGVVGRVLGGTRGVSRGADAVVTGAGSGIGRALARELARRGARVVCADLDTGAAAATVTLVEADGGRGLARHCDVTDAADIDALADAAVAWFGRAPTLVVNNAGVGTGGERIGEDDLDDWRATHEVNFWGVVHGCRTFVPRMRAAGGGGVLNVASAAAFGSAPRMGAYSTSKAAVLSLSETLAAETTGSDITVSVLCPTFVRTGIVGSGRITDEAGALAERLMALTGRDPDAIAATALDALDRGRLHVAPQLEAQLLWMLKRALPGPFVQAAGLVAQWTENLAEGRPPWLTT